MKIYFAGIFSAYQKKAVTTFIQQPKIFNNLKILESYYYVLKSFANDPLFEEYLNKIFSQKLDFLLDSGAFSFLQAKRVNVEIEDYLLKYIDFINKYSISQFFELDIEAIVGMEAVEDMTRLLAKKTGKLPIPVWHVGRGIEYYKHMVNSYPYIAIGGFVSKEIPETAMPAIKAMVNYAKKRNCKVHGLGMTTTRWLTECPFDSVDSTTWLAPLQYGKTFRYYPEEFKLKAIKRPSRKCARTTVESFFYSFEQWIKFIKDAERRL